MSLLSLNTIRIFILIIYLFACTSEELCDRYRYDPSIGKCRNCNGVEGLNKFDRNYIRSSKDAECFDLRGQELIRLHKKPLPEWSVSYDSLHDYNFRGAKMDSARLFFNFIYDADLSGADLSTLQFGYAIVWGKIDQYTILPVEGSCEATVDSLYCSQ